MLYDYSDVYAGMAETVDFIRELLSANPTMNLISDDPDDPEPMAIENDLDKIEYNPIEKNNHGCSLWAIDGGQGTIVRNNVLIAGICRAGYLKFEKGVRTDEMITPLRLYNLTPANYIDIYNQTFNDCHSKNSCERPAFGETLGGLRRVCEEFVILECLKKIRSGDIVLLDGSLRGDKNGFMAGLTQTIKSSGAHLTGVSKASGILWRGGANLTAVLKNEGDRRMSGKSWSAKVGKSGKDTSGGWISDVYVAKLNPCSQNAFRIDLAHCNDHSAKDVFSALSEYATDPFFLGYPYPLAAAHQMVRLTSDELMAFSLRLQDEALRAGVNQNGWNMLFEDYHKILNFDAAQGQQNY